MLVAPAPTRLTWSVADGSSTKLQGKMKTLLMQGFFGLHDGFRVVRAKEQRQRSKYLAHRQEG